MNKKLGFLLAIILLLVYPAGVYASSNHSGGEMNMSHNMDMGSNGTDKNITDGSMNMGGHDMNMDPNMDMGNGTNMPNMTNGSQDHNSEKSVLEPVKGELVGGFAGLNALIIGAAALMRIKRGQGA